MSLKASIIDYGLGNLTSVQNALLTLGVNAEVTRDKEALAASTHLILPGVGSFRDGMKGLAERGLVEFLKAEVIGGKNILGICLGMQLLATKGFEYGEHEGLGILPGEVVKINTEERLPHIGWNSVNITGQHRITAGLGSHPMFYFVHSYKFVPDEKDNIAGITQYGDDIVPIVEKGNIFGTQFHPEKSHDDGLMIFKNFLSI